MSHTVFKRPAIKATQYEFVDIGKIDVRPHMHPPDHRGTLPQSLFYTLYQDDSLWNPLLGLSTFGLVASPMDMGFFLGALEKHLSYPVHTTPWFFSPFISVRSCSNIMTRGNRASSPQSMLKISTRMIFECIRGNRVISPQSQPFIYSLSGLIDHFGPALSKYKDRPYWDKEYLIFKHIPIEAITGVGFGRADTFLAPKEPTHRMSSPREQLPDPETYSDRYQKPLQVGRSKPNPTLYYPQG